MQGTFLSLALFLFSSCSLGQELPLPPSANPTNGTSAQGTAIPVELQSPHYRADFLPLEYHALSWDKGYIVSLGDGGEAVTLYDKSGTWLFKTPLVFQGATKTYVHHVAPTGSASVVVAVSLIDADGASSDLIAEVGKDGIRRVIRTSPFYAFAVCATDEGTVWAYGKELAEDRTTEPRVHYPMLREYSFDKGELRSEVDRASVRPPKGVPIIGKNRSDLQLKCGSDKVALLNGPTNELIEYNLSTNKLDRWPMALQPEGSQITGAALTHSGQLYVSALQGGKPKSTSGVFNVRVTSSGTAEWVPIVVTSAQDKSFHLLGSDGEDLVYSQDIRSSTLFWSVAAPKELAK